MVDEKILTINLRKRLQKTPKWQRSKRSVKILKQILEKQVKGDIKISSDVNEKIWSRSIKNPHAKLRIRIVELEDKTFRAELAK